MVRWSGLVCAGAALVSAVQGSLVALEESDSMEGTTEEPVMTTPAPTSPLVCDQEGNTPQKNTDTEQTYVIAFYGSGDPFEVPTGDSATILWPYAIDKCTALTPTNANAYGIFTCNEDNSMTYQKYEAADCDADSKVGDALTFNGTMQAPLAYNCEGQKDSYAAIEFSLGEGCEANTPTYGVVGVCGYSRLPDKFEWDGFAYLFCNAGGSKLEFFEYTEDQCSNDDQYCSDFVVENTCKFVFSSGENDIYGRTVECNSAEKDEDGGDDSEDSALSHRPALVALFASLFALFAALV